jgi:hypothetical protein
MRSENRRACAERLIVIETAGEPGISSIGPLDRKIQHSYLQDSRNCFEKPLTLGPSYGKRLHSELMAPPWGLPE